MAGTPRDIATLESWFETGDKPTQQQFYDLFASMLHYTRLKQVTGTSTTDIMSQKAVSDALAAISTTLSAVLTAGNDAGAQQIKNLLDPTLAQDADTLAARNSAINTAIATLLDGVAAPGDTLSKLYDLITGLEANKLDAADYNNYFKGKFPTEAAMNAAYIPSQLKAGDNAQVNEVGAPEVRNFSWDTEAEIWKEGGSGGSGASDTDALPEGSTNLYFTTARVLATVITGFASGAGVVASTDTLLQALNKIVGNIALKQDALGFTPEDVANKDTDSTFAANSDTKYPSQKAVKTAVDAKATGTGTANGTNTGDETVPRLATLLHSATLDTSPQDADEIFSYDVGLGLLLRTTWTNVKAFLNTYFATIFEPIITVLSIAKGGTNSGAALSNNRIMKSSGGAVVEAAAITASKILKSDANGIPVASIYAEAEIAPLASPTFTGTVTLPTPAANDNSTKGATTAYVQAQVAEDNVGGIMFEYMNIY